MEHSEDNETKTQYFSTTEYAGGDMYGYTNAKPPEPKEPSKRPGIISFICILGFNACGIALVISLSSWLDELPEWYRPYVILGALAGIAGYIGVWKMKLWGLYLLTLMFIVGSTVAYATGQYSAVSLGSSAILLLVIALNSGKMD
jgi:hypothetical protein